MEVIRCCPDYPNCEHERARVTMMEQPGPSIPNVMPAPSTINAGTSILPDGTPIVAITDMLSGQCVTLNVLEATRFGLKLISLAEQAVTNALIHDSMISNGMQPEEALRFVTEFQKERHRLLRGEKKSFKPADSK